MKIIFFVAQMKERTWNSPVQYSIAETYEQANRITKDCIDRKTYSIVKALENNKDFENELQKLRKEFGIPIQGYSFDEWNNIKKNRQNDTGFISLRHNLRVIGTNKLIRKFNIPYLLQDNLTYVLIGNFLYLPMTRLYLEIPNTLLPVYDGPEIKIVIQSSVSKNQLIKFIENNWEILDREMAMFGQENSSFISDRDTQIIFLRDDKKMKFREIADLLAEEVDDFNINEDMIKIAYHRAKNKISILSKKVS